MDLLIDTGAVERLRSHDRRAEVFMLRHFPAIICTHAVGEYLFGQLRAKVSDTAIEETRVYLESFEILEPNSTTAARYAAIRTDMMTKGGQMSDPDYWIAAHALEGDPVLMSTDQDLQRIEGLRLHYLAPQPRSR